MYTSRGLAQSPQVMFLDEPINHLDIHNQFEFLRLIRDLDLTT